MRSASWHWHSTSSVGLRSAQIGSPIPRIGRPEAAFASTNSCQAGMMRAGLAPSSAMSANTTPSASSPRRARSSAIFSAAIATMTGSPAATASRTNGAASSTNASALS